MQILSVKRKTLQKTKTATIALILMFTLASLAVSTKQLSVDAVDRKSYCFITASPNPYGLNQTGPWGKGVLVNLWVADPTPSATTGIGQFRTGYTVTITRPDDTTEQRMSGSTNPATQFATNIIGRDIDYEGGAYFIYEPTMLGNYTFKFDYAGDVLYTPFPNGARNWIDAENRPIDPNYNYTALPATTTYVLTVQQEPVQGQIIVPRPTEWWERPINAQNYYWSDVSSNWLMPGWNLTTRFFDQNGVFVPEGTVPESAHILWSKQMTFGGLAGGQLINVPYYSGLSYEMYDQPSWIIIGDRFYYPTIEGGESPRGFGFTPQGLGEQGNVGTICVDKRTGEELFTIKNVTMNFGQILNFAGPNQAGTFAYLWNTVGRTWTMYDAWTGNKIVTIANVTTGRTVFGKNGELLNYALYYNSTFYGPEDGSYVVALWNSTRAIESPQPTGTGTVSQGYSWRPFFTYNGATGTPGTIDGNAGIQWVRPAVNTSGYSFSGNGLSQGAFFDPGPVILAVRNRTTSGPTDIDSKIGYNFAAYDMDTGDMLYQSEVLPVPGRPNTFQGIGSFGLVWGYSGHLYAFDHYNMQWLSWDIKTGNLRWITDPLTDPWGYYAQANSIMEGYGYLISASFDGILHGYNLTSGQEEWRWTAGPTGFLTPYGHQTFYDGILVADGKAIVLPNEHGSGIEPLHQDLRINVIDVRDNPGTKVWDILGYYDHPYLSDGIMLSHNNYDNNIIAFGKGPSSTKVEAPTAGVQLGSSVVIRGTVTDVSPGTGQSEQALRFPNGVPAVSDESQTGWMEYVYMQQPFPSNCTGVPVTIDVMDSNGNYRTIGTTSSDASGVFSLTWTPDIPGDFTVIASFAGSNSYWSSYAETSFTVDTPVTPITTPQPTSYTDSYVAGFGIAIIAAIIIIGVLLLRKH